MAFQANYGGHCAGCSGKIEPGDWCDWDDGRPVHQDCKTPTGHTLARKLELQPGETVCTTCWLVKPCDCD